MGAFKFRGAYNFHRVAFAGGTRSRRRCVFERQSRARRSARGAAVRRFRDDRNADAMRRPSSWRRRASYGAQIVHYERSARNREEIARGLAAERGATLVPPFDDARIVAGPEPRDGAAGRCWIDRCDCRAGRRRRINRRNGDRGPRRRPVDVALWRRTAGRRRFRAVARTRRARDHSGAANHRGWIANDLTRRVDFAIARDHVRAVATVSDEELRDAMRFAFERTKLVLEPSGAAALAALLNGRIAGIGGKRVGAILSGGNIDAARYSELIAG